MKKLFIMRHAKSSWDDSSLNDFDRGLSKRGIDSINIMSNVLKKQNICPDTIISSPAKRAKITAIGIKEKISYEGDIVFMDDFYFGNLNDIVEIIKNTNNKHTSLMIFGHNPTWDELVYALSGKYINMATCAFCEINFKTNSWSNISKQQGKFVSFLYPKQYINSSKN